MRIMFVAFFCLFPFLTFAQEDKEKEESKYESIANIGGKQDQLTKIDEYLKGIFKKIEALEKRLDEVEKAVKTDVDKKLAEFEKKYPDLGETIGDLNREDFEEIQGKLNGLESDDLRNLKKEFEAFKTDDFEQTKIQIEVLKASIKSLESVFSSLDGMQITTRPKKGKKKKKTKSILEK